MKVVEVAFAAASAEPAAAWADQSQCDHWETLGYPVRIEHSEPAQQEDFVFSEAPAE